MKTVDRRRLLVLAGGSLAVAAAAPDYAQGQPGFGPLAVPNVHGEWINLGNNRPCAVFQAGAILMLVNETGSIATAHVRGNRFSLMQGWNAANLSGVITSNLIRFSNGSEWQRA